MSFACSLSHRLFSFSSVCCVLKELPVNLAADNPTGEVRPVNMYSTSKPGCIISVMFKGCPSNKQASGGGRLRSIISVFFSSLVKNTGVCRLQRLGWIGSRRGCTTEQEMLNLFLILQKTSKRGHLKSQPHNPFGLSCAKLPTD